MSVYNFRENLEKKDRHIVAKPLSTDVKISPNNTMVMFNLRGTLTRNGVLLRKIIKYVASKAIDEYKLCPDEASRIPILDAISTKLEVFINNRKNSQLSFDEIFDKTAMLAVIDSALHQGNLTNKTDKNSAENITNSIHDKLLKDKESRLLVEKSLQIYDQQTQKNSKPFIIPEVTQLITNLGSLGVPVAIVSNMTQEIVNNAFDKILGTLPDDIQEKYQSKNWYFSKIGVQRDGDGDVIQAVKPAADLLAVSYRKANKFNVRHQKNSIKNIVFVGNSEPFDMRASDNLQRSNYGTDNNLNVYKLLCIHDNPAKFVYDKALKNSNSALNKISDVDKRLKHVFGTDKKSPA
ncbi:MAG: phosphoglycolate phosphatase-like HAD superfamily hydrolase [Alphaproteobacteria bacterium]|jgi:phosphoglycolate phosphatase-like HAD superfamily hydrolase